MKSLKYPVEWLLHHAAAAPQRVWLVQPQGGTTRRWTWAQAAEEIGRMAAALKAQGWPAGSAIAISGRNTAHWFFADLAIQWAGHVSVGLYPKQAAKATRYIFEHCEARAVFLGPMPDGEDFLRSVPAAVKKIRFPYAEAPAGNLDWDAILAGQAPLREYQRPAADALMTLVYTSGTTGNPKGVMMSYQNLAWVSDGFVSKDPLKMYGERLFSYLPLAHLMERMAVEGASLIFGTEVYFLESLDQLAQQLAQAAPTMFLAVPLVWTRIQSGVLGKLPEPRLRRLMAIPLVRTLLRRKLRKALGFQNIRLAGSGAAPIPKATLLWFKQVLDLEIVEGYGMTENGAYVARTMRGEPRPGSVGRPFADSNFRLSEEGEIQVKHPGVMAGYYKDPERTAEAFTADGWLRSGDKGRLDEDGYLYITGRVKDIFKTAKGKYVAPAPIEGALARNTDIEQLCLVGMNLSQPLMMVTLAACAGAKPRADLERQLVADMESVNAALEDHEKIAKLVVAREAWTIDNGMMTPTMKVRRNMVEERYHPLISSVAADRKTAIAWE